MATGTLFDAPEQRKPGSAPPQPPKAKAAPKTKTAKAEPKKKPPEKKATGTAVAVHKPKPPRAAPAPKNAGQMLTFIGTAAMDPRVDPAKMRELLAIRKDLKLEEARDQFIAAELKMQRELPIISKRGKIVIEDKTTGRVKQSTPYARFPDMNRLCKPILQKHGFTIRFYPGNAPDGKITVRVVLSHSGGHQEEATIALPHDPTGSKNATQAVGSSISYAKRYAMVSILNIEDQEEDDDGNLGAGEKINNEQLVELIECCEANGVDKRRFCEFLKVAALADVPASMFQAALAAARSKGGKK